MSACSHLTGGWCSVCHPPLYPAQIIETNQSLHYISAADLAALKQRIAELEELEMQVNWFDSSTHHGVWEEKDITVTETGCQVIGATALCKLCQHTPDWHYGCYESRQAKRISVLEEALVGVVRHSDGYDLDGTRRDDFDDSACARNWNLAMDKASAALEGKAEKAHSLIAKRTVVSEPGAAITVTDIELTEEGRKSLNVGKAKL